VLYLETRDEDATSIFVTKFRFKKIIFNTSNHTCAMHVTTNASQIKYFGTNIQHFETTEDEQCKKRTSYLIICRIWS